MALAACDTAKRDRLSADTLRIVIDPGVVPGAMVFNSTMTLRALCSSAKSSDVDVTPTWTVENNIGVFTPVQGKTTVFKAGTTVGAGKVYAAVGSIRSAGVSFAVGTTSGSVFPTILVLYSDNGLLLEGSHIPDILAWSGDAVAFNPGLVETTGGGASGDAVKFQSDVDSPPNTWFGWGLTLDKNNTGYKRDLTEYASGHLKFYLKTDRALTGSEEVFLNIEEAGGVGAPKSDPVVVNAGYGWNNASSAWQEISVPVSAFTGINLMNIRIPFEITVHNISAITPITMDVDYVRWEK